VAKLVEVARNGQQVARALHGQEARARHAHPDGAPEELDRGSRSRLELQHVAEAGHDALRHENGRLERVRRHERLDGLEIYPEVVRVED
jgi:hypothetical protein